MQRKIPSTDRSCGGTQRQGCTRRLIRYGIHLRARCQQMQNGGIDRDSLRRLLRELDEFCSLAKGLVHHHSHNE